jgi:2-aminoadipate transaminase
MDQLGHHHTGESALTRSFHGSNIGSYGPPIWTNGHNWIHLDSCDLGKETHAVTTPGSIPSLDLGRDLGLDLDLLREGDAPLYRQIAGAIRTRAVARTLTAGVKLPSSRDLAKRLGVHRRTVVAAYQLLEREGLVYSSVGQGTFVGAHVDEHGAGTTIGRSRAPTPETSPGNTGPAVPGEPAPSLRAPGSGSMGPTRPNWPASSLLSHGPDRPDDDLRGLFSWEAFLRRPDGPADLWRFVGREGTAPGAIRFTGATADPALFPTDDFREVLDDAFGLYGSGALEYGPTEGYAPLRQWVAERLHSRGVRADPDEVMIVSGSQQGLDLVARLLLHDGDAVMVEEPGYPNGFRVFQAAGARAVGVPLDDGGLRLDLLERVARRDGPRLLYTMPIFQNPTGLTLADDRTGPLLDLCGRLGLPVVEDQFDADLFYEGPLPRPLRAADDRGLVLLLGSFSKILFPGLRLGWLVVPRPLLAALHELKQMTDFSSGLLAQCAMDLYCRRGLLDRHLERVRAIYGARLRVMLRAMEEEFPQEVRWTKPRGGLTLWVSLPSGLDALDLWAQARREGVDFTPGPVFFPSGGGTGHFRLSYIRETEERIRRGIALLGSLVKAHLARGAAPSAAGPFI